MKKYVYLVVFMLYIIFPLEILGNEDDIFMDYYVEEEKVRTHDLKIIQAMTIQEIDPIKMKDTYSKRIIKYLYNTLFIYDENKEIKSNLLESWNWKDEKTLILKLKEGIYFHNGKLLKAEDIKYSLQRLIKKGVYKEMYSDIEGIEVLNEWEVIIELNKKNESFIDMLTYDMSSIILETNNKVYGTGPYYLSEIDSKKIIMKKNNNYKFLRQESNNYNSIIIYFELNERKRVLKFYKEKIDMIYDLHEYQLSKYIKEELLNKNVQIKILNSLENISLLFGEENNFFKEIEERKLIEKNINFHKIIQKILKKEKSTSFFPDKFFKANLSKIDKKDFKVKESDSKIKYGEIELSLPNNYLYNEIGEEIKKQLEKKGFKINIVLYSYDAYLKKIEKKDFQLSLYGIIFNGDNLTENLNRIFKYDIRDLELYNGILPFLKMLKNEKKIENRDKINDKIASLIYQNRPYIPIVTIREIVIEQ